MEFQNDSRPFSVRTAYYIRGLELMKFNFCRFRCVINDGLYTFVTKQRFILYT